MQDAISVSPLHNVEAEESILGGILLDPNAFDRVRETLTPQSFYSSAHERIYTAMELLHSQGSSVDLMTVTTWLSDRGKLESVGGTNKLAQLLDRTVSAVNIDRYALLVQEKYKRRKIREIASQLHEAIADPDATWQDIVAAHQKELFDLQDDRKEKGAKPFCDVLTETWDELEALNAGDDATFSAIPTGYTDLDETIGGGLQVGTLSVLAARSGVGKTSFALDLALRAASAGNPTVYYSLEMTRSQLARKALAWVEGGNNPKAFDARSLFRRNGLSLEQFQAILECCESGKHIPLWLNDTSSISPTDIRGDLNTVRQRSGKAVEFVVVDYVGLMRGDPKVPRYLQLDYILSDLRTIAKDFNVPILCLAQINRAVDGRADKRPTKADLRETSGLENEAALVFGLYRDEVYDANTVDKNLIEVLCLKNRFGPTGTTKLVTDLESNRFYNLANGSY